MRSCYFRLIFAIAVCLRAASLDAADSPLAALPALIDAPPAPVAPATIARDPQNRATLRAVRIRTPLRIDGKLDEEAYRVTAAAGGWVQQTPKPGEPATEPTDVWVFFDDDNVYISMKLHETHPERRVGTERRRDNQGLTNDDNVMLVLDTFYDRRNAFNFQVNAVGGLRDQIVTDGSANGAWNTVWDVKVADCDGGQAFEMRIPFKSLRYKESGPQVWGFNARRTTKWKNEVSYINPNPVAYGGPGINRLQTAATLVGIETPARSMNLELKPYGITSITTDKTAPVPFVNNGTVNGGFDFKYGLTRGLTADVTVNTDFAQVEEDVQQVNLTRFSLFFPEKRDFFLEGLGQFAFAGQGSGDRLDGTTDTPTMFFSRRVGLNNGQAVPVRAGARVTGRAAGFELGLLNIQTADHAPTRSASTNYSAARVRRNILRRSNVGMITTLRHPGSAGQTNAAFGADSNLRFYDNIEANMYLAGTKTTNRPLQDETSYRGRFAFLPDQWGFSVEHLKVGANFNPEIGFVRRSDFRSTQLAAKVSPRFKRHPVVRQLIWNAGLDYITNAAATRVENRNISGDFAVDFQNSDRITVGYTDQYELLPQNFRVATGVVVPRGGYNYGIFNAGYTLGQQHFVSGTISFSRGSFYNGTRTTGGYGGRLNISPRFIMEPSLTLNRVDLPYGRFSANLFNTRIVSTPTPRMQLASLIQVNPALRTMNASIRFRWEYTPGSELFVVYADGRNTASPGFPDVLNRSFAIKVTRLLRF